MKEHKSTAIVMGALLAVVSVGASAQEAREQAGKIADQARAAVTPGEVVLTGSDSKTLHKGDEAHSYRICVKPEEHASSVRVTSDAVSPVSLKPGECQIVSGMQITATPEKPLTGAMRSTVTFDQR